LKLGKNLGCARGLMVLSHACLDSILAFSSPGVLWLRVRLSS
jgi:hypothetical protein